MDLFLKNKAYFIKGISQIFNDFPTLNALSFEINNTCNPLILWIFPIIIINQERKSWLIHSYEYYKYKNYDEKLPKINDNKGSVYNFEQFLNYLKLEVPYFNNSQFISQLHSDLMKKNQSPWFTINKNQIEKDILDFCGDKAYCFYESIIMNNQFPILLPSSEDEKKPIKI